MTDTECRLWEIINYYASNCERMISPCTPDELRSRCDKNGHVFTKYRDVIVDDLIVYDRKCTRCGFSQRKLTDLPIQFRKEKR